MTLDAIGYGAGTRDLKALPNVVRAILGTEATTGTVSLIEANLDDLLPELAPDAAAACFAAGALDVWTTPVHMKHGRPALHDVRPRPAGPTSARSPRRCCARRARSACASPTSTASSSSATT